MVVGYVILFCCGCFAFVSESGFWISSFGLRCGFVFRWFDSSGCCVLRFVFALGVALVLLGWIWLYLGCGIRLFVGIVISCLLLGGLLIALLFDYGCAVPFR